MNEWPEFNNHPNHRIDDCDEMEFVWLTEDQYNQARDAVAWQEKARSVYPNVDRLISLADKIKNAPLKPLLPQPTGDV